MYSHRFQDQFSDLFKLEAVYTLDVYFSPDVREEIHSSSRACENEIKNIKN